MFDVFHDARVNLVEATLAGLLDVPEVARYVARVEPVIATAAARATGYTMLIDVSGCAIQPQAVVAVFQRHVAGVARAQRCAVVTGSSIIRMQMRRILTGSAIRMFDDRDAARTWLLADRRPALAAG